SWRTIFLINVPIGLINVGLAVALLRETAVRKDARMDLRGFILSAIAFPGLLVGLSQGDAQGWTSPFVVALLIGGALALWAFIRTELGQAEPLLDIRLIGHPMFKLGLALNFITQFSLFGVQYILPLFLQLVHGLTASQTGLTIVPTGICTFISMHFSGRLYNRAGPRPLAVIGLVVMMGTTALLSRMTPQTDVVLISALASMRGLAMGLCMIPVQTMIYNTIPQAKISRAPALTNVFFRLYASVSTAILTTILVVSVSQHGARPGTSIAAGTTPVDATVAAFSDALLVMTGLSAIGVILAFFVKDSVAESFKRGELGRREVPVEA
ncbi:MAG: MFS transporter, partial [Chloroflexota bacterium]|nr:MFS transporter [Chloroflexota bacterium]